MVWLLKTLSFCVPLYRLSAFHFTDCKNHGKDLAIHFSWLVTLPNWNDDRTG